MSNIELKDLIELHLSSIREEIRSMGKVSELKFDAIMEKQDEQIQHQIITNGRVTKLENKQIIKEEEDRVKKEKDKKLYWKMAAMVVAAGFIASLISSVGLFEFLKLLK